MSSPILYAKNTTNFMSLGLGVLADAISCTVVEERNGIFELEMEYPLEGTLFHLIENDVIIKADAGHKLKNQLFRVKKVTKKDDGIALVYAQHISYLTQDLALKPDITLSGTALSALQQWKEAIIDENPFEVYSDLSEDNIQTTSLTINDYQNARQVLGGINGSILQRWQGEYEFNNYNISLLRSRGKFANTLISYGRNLTSLEQEENITNTFTSIYPFAIYRSKTEEDEDSNEISEEEVIITLSEWIVDSEHVDKFPNRRILPVNFSSEFENDELPTQVRLRELAEQYIIANNIGVPTVSLNVSFVDLTKMLNYTGSRYEEVNLCDTVPVYFEKLGIHTLAKIIRVEWNVLLEQYNSLEIGESRVSLSDKLKDMEQGINNAQNTANHAIGQSGNAMGQSSYATQKAQDALNKADDLNQKIIDEIERVEGLIDDIEIPDIDLSGIYGEIGGLKDRFDEADEQFISINESIDGLQTTVGKITEDIDGEDGIRWQLTEVSQTVDGFKVTVESLDESVNGEEGLNYKVGNLEQTATHFQTQLNDFEEDLNGDGGIAQRVGSLEVTSSEINGRVTNVEQDVGGEGGLKEQVGEMRLTVDEWSTTIANIEESLDGEEGIHQQISQINQNISEIGVTVADIQEDINGEGGILAQIGEFEVTATEIAMSVSKTVVEDAINELQIGGRNLLRNSDVSTTSSEYEIKTYELTEYIEEETEVTLSLSGELGEGRTSFGIFNSGDEVNLASLSPEDRGVDGVFRKTFKWKINQSPNTHLYIYQTPNIEDIESTIGWAKLELGNMASDWSPAPGDISEPINELTTRMYVAEMAITPENMTSTVMASEDFLGILDQKVGQDELGNFVTNDAVQNMKNDFENALDETLGQANEFTNTVISNVEQRVDSVETAFTNAGGVNYIQNSIGLSGFDFWALDPADTDEIKIIETGLNDIGATRGFGCQSTKRNEMFQDVPTTAGQYYTLSLKYRQTGSAWWGAELFIAGTSERIALIQGQMKSTEGWIEEVVAFRAMSNLTRIRLGFDPEANVDITSMMLNVGESKFNWTPHPTEVYSTSVRMDSQGLRVENNTYDGHTVMSPSEFAGYYRNSQEEERVKVFSMDKDEFVMHKANVDSEITMKTVKVIPIDNDAFKGWVFVGATS